MRILLLSFVLALPLASLASANDPSQDTPGGILAQRTIGLGIGQDLRYVGLGDGASLVDETSLRWQASRRFALEPNVRFGARNSENQQTGSQNQAAHLGTRLRVTAASSDKMHLVGLLGFSGSLSRTKNTAFGAEEQYDYVFASVSSGLGIEYAPKRWWGLGVDYRVALAEGSRFSVPTDMDQAPQTDWRFGPTDSGRLVATAHVYF